VKRPTRVVQIGDRAQPLSSCLKRAIISTGQTGKYVLCKAGFFYPRTSVLQRQLHKTFSNNRWDQKQKYNRQTVKINFAAATEQGEQTIRRY
jgi:hypothetical protein